MHQTHQLGTANFKVYLQLYGSAIASGGFHRAVAAAVCGEVHLTGNRPQPTPRLPMCAVSRTGLRDRTSRAEDGYLSRSVWSFAATGKNRSTSCMYTLCTLACRLENPITLFSSFFLLSVLLFSSFSLFFCYIMYTMYTMYTYTILWRVREREVEKKIWI